MVNVNHYDYRRPLWVFSCTHNSVIRRWLPTLNFCGWTGRNRKHGLAPMQSKINLLGFRRDVPASAVDVVVENNTTLFYHSTTLFVGDSHVHFGRGEYHFTPPLSLTTVYPRACFKFPITRITLGYLFTSSCLNFWLHTAFLPISFSRTAPSTYCIFSNLIRTRI
jgi:hypothetical protein